MHGVACFWLQGVEECAIVTGSSVAHTVVYHGANCLLVAHAVPTSIQIGRCINFKVPMVSTPRYSATRHNSLEIWV